MRVLHLLASGGIGGIETLIRNYAGYSQNENYFLFAYEGGIIADELAAMNKNVLHAPDGARGSIKILKWILSMCKELKADTIISHHSSPVFKVVLMCVKIMMPHIRVFAYAHANALFICGSEYKGYKIRKAVNRAGFAVADGVIAISNAVKDSLVKALRVKSDKIFVLYNAIELPQVIHPIEAFHEKVKLIYVGRLVREKGVQTLISAISYGDLKNKIHLTIVGDGDYREYLEQLACELQVEQMVDFVGNQRNIHPYLQKADVFIHCPECEEGFGVTVIEAMAHGLLCICSDNGALPELIKDGENGCLVAAHSPQALFDKIKWVINNKDQKRSFAEIRKAAQEYAQKFNFETYTHNLEEYLLKR